MRNLKILKHSACYLDSDLPLATCTWNTTSESVVCAFGPSRAKEVIELKSSPDITKSPNRLSLRASWNAPCPLPGLGIDKVLDLHHFDHSDTSCLVLAGGDIVVVRGGSFPEQEKIEIVGSVDSGITAAAWSPDGELLAVATRAETLLFMTADFENAASNSFIPEDAQVSKQVNVGWGKSETQFRGKRAKALHDPTVPEKVDDGTLSPMDQRQVSLSWRGDGAFVAVNSVESGKRRMIRVYSREGELDGVSEPVDGLEGALSWKSNLLTGVQRCQDSVQILFFERNGLRHGCFPLRLSTTGLKGWASAIDLKWNIDSSILAVVFCDRVQFWTVGNYHYYLKQEICIPCPEYHSLALQVVWHPEKPLYLAIQCKYLDHDTTTTHQDEPLATVRKRNRLDFLQFDLCVNGGSMAAPYDFGTVAVVDGDKLKVTPLRIANVPPPMALHEFDLQSTPKDFAFSLSGNHVAILYEHAVSVWSYFPQLSPVPKPVIDQTISLPISGTVIARQVSFNGNTHIFVLLTDVLTGVDIIFDAQTSLLHRLPLKSSVVKVFATLNHESLCAVSGNIVAALSWDTIPQNDLQNSVSVRNICEFPVAVSWTEIVFVSGGFAIAFGLTAAGAFYANDRQLLRDCTSCLVTQTHLLVTTTHHLLKFIHLATSVSDLEVPPDQPEVDERCRSIERGAKLVAVMPTSSAVVLQMPRGNLETIYPRALVLAGIRRNIANKDYRSAFLACRTHRVDMNIINDYAPDQFLASIELFIGQLSKVEYVDLFLSQLREEDVTITKYRETIPTAKHNGTLATAVEAIKNPSFSVGQQPSSKVNRICDAFLGTLEHRHSSNIQNIITANMCKIPPDIAAALALIAALREKQSDLADSAIEHICFLADVNQIYNQALGMYDLDIALLVAQQAQKDPREYLPYLQTLEQMPQLRRHYAIDDDLGRYEKALKHLHSLNEFEEFKSYMVKHELYKSALQLYRYDTERQSLILSMYAEHLSRMNRFKDAGIAYESLSDYAAACEAYRAANLWRECLSAATAIPWSSEELSRLAHSLGDGLVQSKDYHAAATIHLNYLSNVEQALQYMCKAYQFSEAISIAYLRRRPELLESVVDVGLVEGFATLTDLLADCKSQLEAQVPRLRELRRKKAEDPLGFFEGAVSADIPDNVSLAPTNTSTSGGTFLTRYTNRTGTINTNATRKTSKNRRREERKRARGKKGSVYEEEYLVNSIERLIERVNSVSEDAISTVDGLLRRRMRERASALDSAMVQLTNAFKECLDEVFQFDGKAGESEDEGFEERMRPPGADGVFWDSLQGVGKRRPPPTIKVYQQSELLNP